MNKLRTRVDISLTHMGPLILNNKWFSGGTVLGRQLSESLTVEETRVEPSLIGLSLSLPFHSSGLVLAELVA